MARLSIKYSLVQFVATIVSTFFICAFIVQLMRKGIGFADETLYLILADSSDTTFSYGGLWSFYTHHFAAIVDGDIYGFRVLGALLIFSFSTLLGYQVARLNKQVETEIRSQISIALSLGVASFFFYQKFLLVPGYDWLTLVGLLIGLNGFFLTMSEPLTYQRTGSFLIGSGAFIASTGRPLAGVIFLVAVWVVWLNSAKAQKKNLKIWYLVTGLMVMSIFHLLFIANFKDSINSFILTAQISAADPAHNISYLLKTSIWDLLTAPILAIQASAGFIIAITVMALIAKYRRNWMSRKFARFLVLGLLVGQISLTFILGKFGGGSSGEQNGYVWIGLTFSYALTAYIVNTYSEFHSEGIPRSLALAASIPVAAAIFAATFSSDIGIVRLSSQLGVFYCLLLFIVSNTIQDSLVQRGLHALTSILIVVGLMVAFQKGMDQHYDSDATNLQTVSTRYGPHNSSLTVDAKRSNEINQVRQFKQQGLVRSTDAVLNLTPVAIYIPYELGFRNVKTLLLPNQTFAEQYVRDNEKALKDAWLLTTESKYRDDPIEPAPVTEILGRSFPDDYRLVTTFSGKYCLNTVCVVNMWKPIE